MKDILEMTMLISFGVSWPINLVKCIQAKTAKNTSGVFIICILVGYVAGIASKLISQELNYVLIFYIFNLLIVTANLIVYMINKKYDEKNNIANKIR